MDWINIHERLPNYNELVWIEIGNNQFFGYLIDTVGTESIWEDVNTGERKYGKLNVRWKRFPK